MCRASAARSPRGEPVLPPVRPDRRAHADLRSGAMSPRTRRSVVVLTVFCAVLGVVAAIIGNWLTAATMVMVVIGEVLNLRRYRSHPARL